MSEPTASSVNGTTVRAGFAAQVTFRILQATSTELGARALERVFLTPPRRKPTAEERAFLASGEREVVASPAGSLALWSWGEGRTVLLAHGWGSHTSRYRTLVPALLAAGHRVVAFDAPGHGESTGRRSSLPEAARALRFVARRERARRGAWPSAVIGHSFGGAALILAQDSGVRFERNVLLAPDLPGYLDRMVSALGIERVVVRRMIARLEQRLGFSWDAIHLTRVVGQFKVPALIVHDPSDAEVPYADAQALRDAWPGARLESVHGLGHRRILHDPLVVQRVAAFVASR